MTIILNPTDSQIIRLIKLATEISIDYSSTNNNKIDVNATSKKISIYTIDETSIKYLNMLDTAKNAKILCLSNLNITNEEVNNLIDKLLLIDSNCLTEINLLGNHFTQISLDKVTKLLSKHKKLRSFKINKRVANFKEIEKLETDNLISYIETIMKQENNKDNEDTKLNYYL